MRIARYTVDDRIQFGVVELEADGGANPETVSALTADPLSGPVKLTGERHDLAGVRLLAPVIPRSKVVGLARTGGAGGTTGRVAEPAIFLKPNTSVIGPGEAIQLPPGRSDVAITAELAIVVGRIARSVPLERVPEVIFGYTVANDVTARGFVGPDAPWGLAKSWDSFTPLGPWIATHLSLEEVGSLALSTAVDGDWVSGANLADMAQSVAAAVSFISGVMTLLPGDVILPGATAGWTPIRAGQQVSIDIDEIGSLTNPVVDA